MTMENFLQGAIAGAAVVVFTLSVSALVSAGPVATAIALGSFAFIAACGFVYAAIIKCSRRKP